MKTYSMYKEQMLTYPNMVMLIQSISLEFDSGDLQPQTVDLQGYSNNKQQMLL